MTLKTAFPQINTITHQSDHRIEKKYVSHRPEYSLALLRSLFIEDTDFPENFVYNIHFDTANLEFLGEKLNGNLKKQKIRVRWYSDTKKHAIPEIAKLECKTKDGARGYKSGLMINMPSKNVNILLKGETWRNVLLKALLKVQPNQAASLYPIMLSRYRRRRFFDPKTNARISYDDQITCVALSSWVRATGYRVSNLPDTVIELKTDGEIFIPSLQVADHLRLSSFSKYGFLLSRIA